MRTCCNRVLVFIALLLIGRSAMAQSQAELGRLVGQAQELEKQEQFADAIATYNRAAVLAARLFGQNHLYVGTLSGAAGHLNRELGQYVEAEKRLAKALAVYELGTELGLVAEGVNNLATVKFELGKYDESLALHRRSVKLLATASGENSVDVAVARSNLAGVLNQLGQTTEAETLYFKSLKTLEANRATQAKRLADTLANLANVYQADGEMARAESLVQRAVLLKEQQFGPRHFEVARTLNNLASLHSQMGQHAKAEEELERAIKMLETTLGADHADVARSLTNLAAAKLKLDKKNEVEALYLRALKIQEGSLGKDHPDVATTWEHLGSFYATERRFDESEAAALRSLQIRREKLGEDHPRVAYSLSNLAHLRLIQNRKADAEDLLNQVIAIRTAKLPASHPDIAVTNASLGWIYASDKWIDQALPAFDKSRRGLRSYIEQTLSVLSEPEQLLFLLEFDQPQYHTALSAAFAQRGQRAVDLSATWVLNSKGIAQQVLAQRALVNRDSTNPAVSVISQALVAIRKQLASLSLTGSESADDAARQKKIEELTRREAEIARQMNAAGGRPVSRGEFTELDRVRRNIADDAVLIEIVRFQLHDFVDPAQVKFPERYVAWIIPPAGDSKVRLVDLGPAEPIDAAIASVRETLTKSIEQIREAGEPEAEAKLRQGLQPLAKLVFEPLLEGLGDCQKLYLSPDAGLWLVPWSAMPLADGKYAVERFDIRYLISGRDLIPSETPPITATRPILMADPNYDLTPAEVQAATQQLFKGRATSGNVRVTRAGENRLGHASRLPGTKTEAKAIQPKIESLARTEAYLYTDKWALEAVFKSLRQPQFLVLCTHGFFREQPTNRAEAQGSLNTVERGLVRIRDDHLPLAAASYESSNPLLRCGLLLAGCNHPADVSVADVEDGILTGLEIVGTDLRGTDLVVLSACETGLGDIRNGEGVSGLRQAFQLAGAKSVVATLWQIPDLETARLMTEFFSRLASGIDRSAALREAQLKIIASRRERNEAAHPFFWAAFTITGQ